MGVANPLKTIVNVSFSQRGNKICVLCVKFTKHTFKFCNIKLASVQNESNKSALQNQTIMASQTVYQQLSSSK